MSATIINLIIQIIAGIIGGNAAGAGMKNANLGTGGNTVAGAIGGIGGGWLLGAIDSEPRRDSGGRHRHRLDHRPGRRRRRRRCGAHGDRRHDQERHGRKADELTSGPQSSLPRRQMIAGRSTPRPSGNLDCASEAWLFPAPMTDRATHLLALLWLPLVAVLIAIVVMVGRTGHGRP